MTIKEFYEWAKENGIEDFKMVMGTVYGEGEFSKEDWIIRKEEKEVYTE